MMQAPPRIFDSKGALIPDVDTSGLDASALALLENVRVEYAATKEAELALQDAFTELAASEQAVKDTKEYHDAHFPPQSFHSLWLENFGTEKERQRAAAPGGANDHGR